MALTQVTDVVVPEVFDPYIQQLTERKNRLINAGVAVRSPIIDEKLAGGGSTFKVPSFQDLADVEENTSGDDPADVQTLAAGAGTTLAAQNDARPQKTSTSQETLVRLERNQHWSSSDLAGDLAGADPMGSIASRVSNYWAHRLQVAFISMMNGIIADNTANDSGDFTLDVSGASFQDGVTNFSAESFLDAILTMGDSQDDLGAIMVHSTVYNRMQKNNLIDFREDSEGNTRFEVFQGRRIIIDDSMPNTSGVFDTWIFGAGAAPYGAGMPKVPSEVHREPLAGGGGGQEILSSRVVWSLHLIGMSYIGTSFPDGGPRNTSGTAPLNAAASWNRVYPERKQIKFARLVTRES